jgi:S-disulfanyl-L-cysteine oxidoreductase SoxD
MKRAAVFCYLALSLIACTRAAEPLRGQSQPAAVSDVRTIWAGVFSAEQARRGERGAESACVLCHSASEWEFVVKAWSGRPLHDLFEKVRTTMPEYAPGQLTRQQYVDIIAYMLKLYGAPIGTLELSSGEEALRNILVTPREEP